MSLAEAEHAPQVCSTCKIRKKRCDKALPSCGYCTKRSLICRYEDSPRPVVAQYPTGSASPSLNALLMQVASLFAPSTGSKPMTVDELVDLQVCRIMQLTNMSLHEICKRFFHNFHRWLPVVSSTLLHENAAKYRLGDPPADFSVLLAAMCLITLRPSADTSSCPLSPESLYVTVRMLFAHAQSMLCASTFLIQANILIAAYEYANGRPDAAHYSIGVCARMAYTVGIDEAPLRASEGKSATKSKLEEVEKRNLWWGIVILERIVLCEITGKKQRPITDYPSQDCLLPNDLQPGEDEERVFDVSSPRLSTLPAMSISSFGLQAQAVCLLDKVLQITRVPADAEGKYLELRRLDGNIQAFLTVLMGKSRVWGPYCSPMASGVRALFLLHQEILTNGSNSVEPQWMQHSRSALGTASKILVDVASHHMRHIAHNKDDVDLLPLCCSYNVRLAMKYLKEYVNSPNAQTFVGDMESLVVTEKTFNERWKPSHNNNNGFGLKST